MSVVSRLPGRLRIRHPLLRDPRRIAEAGAQAWEVDGVEQVEAQPITGSLLIRYDHYKTTEDQLLSCFTQYISGRTFSPRKPNSSPAPGRRVWRRAVNLGMLGSLGLSVYAAYRISKKSHVALGYLFLAVSLEHLRLNRRRLFR